MVATQMARSVHRQGFKAKFFEPHEREANALLAGIERELPEVDYFTREDLLHLTTFNHVATITRYNYVRAALDLLIRKGAVVAKSRTDLCLPKASKRYNDGVNDLGDRYQRVIKRCINSQSDDFGVMDVVALWKADPHLTVNTKRVAVRAALKVMVREGTLEKNDDYTYRKTPGE